jgi:hypothetical protein
MYGKICSRVVGIVRGFRHRMGFAVAVASVATVSVLSSASAFAQEMQPIPVQAPDIDWLALPQTLIGVLTTPMVVGIGIGLSVWIIIKAMIFFKRSAT